MRLPIVVALSLIAAGAAQGQGSDRSIDPGMTKAQVIEHLGQPAAQRSYDGKTYLLYPNHCKSCGMQDFVVLENDAVVDAVFRASSRHFTGNSSSPAALTPAEARVHASSTLTVQPPAPKAAVPAVSTEQAAPQAAPAASPAATPVATPAAAPAAPATTPAAAAPQTAVQPQAVPTTPPADSGAAADKPPRGT
jgi:hypothetical protein